METDVQRETLTVPEAAIKLGLSRKAAYSAARRGQIPTIRIGKRILVLKDQLDQMMGKRAA